MRYREGGVRRRPCPTVSAGPFDAPNAMAFFAASGCVTQSSMPSQPGTGAVTQRYGHDPLGTRHYANGRYDEFGALLVDWSTPCAAATRP